MQSESGAESLLHKSEENRIEEHEAEDNAVGGESVERVRADVGEQPFHRDKGNDAGDDKSNRDIDRLATRVGDFVAGFKQGESARSEHGRNTEQEGEFGRSGTRLTEQHGADDRGSGTRCAGKNRGDKLRDAHGDGDLPRDGVARLAPLQNPFRSEKQNTADQHRPRDRCHVLRQLQFQCGDDRAAHDSNPESRCHFDQIIAILRLGGMLDHVDDVIPINEQHGDDSPELNDDIKGVRARAEPMFGNEEMAGGRNGKELRNAFDDA